MRITVVSPVHERCLYEGEADLIRRLESALENSWETHMLATDLAWEIKLYEWEEVAWNYDEAWDAVVRRRDDL